MVEYCWTATEQQYVQSLQLRTADCRRVFLILIPHLISPTSHLACRYYVRSKDYVRCITTIALKRYIFMTAYCWKYYIFWHVITVIVLKKFNRIKAQDILIPCIWKVGTRNLIKQELHLEPPNSLTIIAI